MNQFIYFIEIFKRPDESSDFDVIFKNETP